MWKLLLVEQLFYGSQPGSDQYLIKNTDDDINSYFLRTTLNLSKY